MNKSNLNGWAISEDLLSWIHVNLKKGSTILELGSGTGTIELTKDYKVYSIEHDSRWLNKAKDSNYLYAPIKDYDDYRWYDIDVVKSIDEIKYDLIIVDGPPGTIGREGFLYNIELFDTDVTIIIDDSNRPDELKLAKDLAFNLGRKYKPYGGSEKSFIII